MAKLISVDDALGLIAKTAKPLPIVDITFKDANGHVIAKDMHAKVTLPPLDASAMDGYAVKLEEHHKQGSIFTLIGESPAGAPYAGEVGADKTVRIFTGGAVPSSANHVIMQENVNADGTAITLTQPISPAPHIRKAGIDFAKGDIIVKAGTELGAYELAILAAANCADLPVTRRPLVALIANGDELVSPGSTVTEGQVISSNPYGLAPLLESWGADTINMGISKDDPKAIETQIRTAIDKGADILVPIGGASVGERDYMRSVFSDMGYEKRFEKVAVKPGKPVWFGTLGDRYVLGLAGNPASALVTAHVFLKPLVKALCGNAKPANPFITARTTTDLKANTWRSEYVRAHAKVDERGVIHVTPYPRQDSSLLTPFLTANCFMVRGADTPALNVGDPVSILMIGPLA